MEWSVSLQESRTFIKYWHSIITYIIRLNKHITQMSATRNNYLDFLRGIAILLVVVGHCIQFGSGSAYLKSGLYFANPLFKFIYSFHMPLFMLISGYLGWFSISKKTHKDFVIDKCKGILIPLIAWHTLFQSLQILTNFSRL